MEIDPRWKKQYNISTLRIKNVMAELEEKWRQKQAPAIMRELGQGAVEAPKHEQYNKGVPGVQQREGEK